MNLKPQEFKELLCSNFSERIYQRCRSCDRRKVESELNFLLDNEGAHLPVKGLSREEVIKAFQKGIAAHDSFMENAAKGKSAAKEVIKTNPNQTTLL